MNFLPYSEYRFNKLCRFWLRRSIWRILGMMIKTFITVTEFWALNASLEAFTIVFAALWLAAVATFEMFHFVLLWPCLIGDFFKLNTLCFKMSTLAYSLISSHQLAVSECLWIPVQNLLGCPCPRLFVMTVIFATKARARTSTHSVISKALAVQFQTLRLATIARFKRSLTLLWASFAFPTIGWLLTESWFLGKSIFDNVFIFEL